MHTCTYHMHVFLGDQVVYMHAHMAMSCWHVRVTRGHLGDAYLVLLGDQALGRQANSPAFFSTSCLDVLIT